MINLLLLKTLMIFVIFACGLFGVLSPRLFQPFSSKLSYASLLSSGVLLSSAMVHLLGEASDGLNESPLPNFPWAYFFCGLSFYLLYFFERWVIHYLFKINSIKKDKYTPSLVHENELLLPINMNHDDHSNHMHDDHNNDILQLMKQRNYLSAIVLLIGLGLHSFLAGIGFGSSQDIQQIFGLSVAIISHKYLAAFTLGCPLYSSKIELKIHIYIALLFSIITPFGIIIGLFLLSSLDNWISNIFISIAAGTFIYVAIIEILIPEFSEIKSKQKIAYKIETSLNIINCDKEMQNNAQQRKIKSEIIANQQEIDKKQECTKALCVLAGFCLMSVLAIWV